MDVQNLSVIESIRTTNGIKDAPNLAEIQAWIVSYVAELLEIPAKQVDTTIEFDRYGLDSSAAVGLIGELEDWLGKELDPTLLYDYPTIKALSKYLATSL